MNIAAVVQCVLTISAVWLAVSIVMIVRMMNPVWMVYVFHLQNAQVMQTVQMDKYVMMKANAHIATMIQNVILDKNVSIMFAKIQNAQTMQTVQMDKYVNKEFAQIVKMIPIVQMAKNVS